MSLRASKIDGDKLYRRLPSVNFISFFSIALIEFAIPYIAVSQMNASPVVIAALGISRYLPQVLFAGWSARIVNNKGYRFAILLSESLRVAAFLICLLAVWTFEVWAFVFFVAATIAVSVASVLTGVAVAVVVPLSANGARRSRFFSNLSVAESVADAGGPFIGGVIVGSLGSQAVFAVAALGALAAFAILLTLPHIMAIKDACTVTGSWAKGSLWEGFRINFGRPGLKFITWWGVVYNGGQSIFMASFLIVLLERTALGSFGYGIFMASAVAFAILGAYMPQYVEKLPGSQRPIFPIVASLALIAYFVQGVSLALLQGTIALILVWVGMILDEGCSAASGVFISTYRAREISDEDRAAATAANRTVGMLSVVIGYAVGAGLSLATQSGLVLLVIGLAMSCGSALVFNKVVLESRVHATE